jgi:nicotinate dehydrogenase subunit B
LPLRLAQPRGEGDAARGEGDEVKRISFNADGTVSIHVGKVEIGQGIVTALAQIASEELDVPIEKIRMLPASTADSPDEGVTSGSLSIQDGGKSLRAACAEFKANKLAKDYKVVGKSAARLDLPGKIAGKPSYVQDMVLPDMLHARVVRPNRSFSRLVSLDGALPGVTVVRDGSFVGVLAEREEDAVKAAAKLKAKGTWSDGPRVPADYHGWLKEHVAERHPAKEQSDPAAKARAKKTLKAEFRKQFIAHASIGPSCAVARMQGGKLEVWSHTQGIYGLRKDLAKVLAMKEEDIVVTHAEGAGCYGHNGADDVALDAALLARAANGRPVRLQWMREDEFAWEPYGTAMAVEMEASLDAEGRIVSWRHDLFSNGQTHRPGRAEKVTLTAAAQLEQPMPIADPVDPPLPSGGANRNAIPGYDFPDTHVMFYYVRDTPVRSSSVRSLGGFGNVFAIESFMDELATAAGIDPVVFRLNHLKDPRGRAVIEKAAEASQWGAWKRPEGRGHGIAYARYKNIGSYCAVVAEVEAGHELKVNRIVAVADAGLIVNPDGVANQLEGGCIQAASWTLKEEVRPNATATWEDYPILRFSEVPKVEIHLLNNEHPSLGAGECTMGPVAAAIANALYDALGVRARELPLTPERITKAMG